MGNVVGKVWGDTSALIQNSFVELHKINAKAGFRCSEHKHAHKWNGFYVIRGVLEIHVRKNDYALTDVTTLRAGDFTTVRPGEYHWFKCVEDCVALELYYPEMLSEDIQRRDHGGPTYDLQDVVDSLDKGSEQDIPDLVAGKAPMRRLSGTAGASPCVKICKVDVSGTRCVGCGRTLDEIRDYGLKGTSE